MRRVAASRGQPAQSPVPADACAIGMRGPELPDKSRCGLGQGLGGGRELGVVALRSVVGAHDRTEQPVLADA